MQTIQEKNFNDIHYDILENFYKQKDFNEILEKNDEYCMNKKQIKNNVIHNLSANYSDDEIDIALNDLCKTQYINEIDGKYCAPKNAYRLNAYSGQIRPVIPF